VFGFHLLSLLSLGSSASFDENDDDDDSREKEEGSVILTAFASVARSYKTKKKKENREKATSTTLQYIRRRFAAHSTALHTPHTRRDQKGRERGCSPSEHPKFDVSEDGIGEEGNSGRQFESCE
jgi:hypothetical protein